MFYQIFVGNLDLKKFMGIYFRDNAQYTKLLSKDSLQTGYA